MASTARLARASALHLDAPPTDVTAEPHRRDTSRHKEVSMGRILLTGAVACLLAAGCQPATTELTDAQKAEIEEAVKQASTDLWAAWVAQEDVDEYLSHTSNWVVPWGGFASVDALRSSILGTWERQNWEIRDLGEVEVLVLGTDAAALKATAVCVVTDTAGTAQELTQDYAGVWVREDGHWKLLMSRLFNQLRDM
jgi:hypothetical protein